MSGSAADGPDGAPRATGGAGVLLEELTAALLGVPELGDSVKALLDHLEQKVATETEYDRRPVVRRLRMKLSGRVADVKTEKGAAAYSTTGSPLLDLFAESVRGADQDRMTQLFASACEEDIVKALAMLLLIRDARDGKGERKLAYYLYIWLRTYMSATYVKMLPVLIDHGYFKDLLQLTALAHQGSLPKLGKSSYVELELLADHLRKDKAALDKAEDGKAVLSLAAKWAPTEKSAFDKEVTGYQARELAKLLFPELPLKAALKAYRKEYLTPLRAQLKVVERLMSLDQWDQIDFQVVPSKAHRLLRTAFGKHQAERYAEYQHLLTQGKAKVCAKGTQPHELVQPYMRGSALDATLEGQWEAVLAELCAKGCLERAQGIVDTSGSMTGLPMEVAIALGILMSQLTSSFQGEVITFHESPSFFKLPEGSLKAKVDALKRAPWGGTTNLLKAFRLMLDKAVADGVSPAEMVETFYIFTDMQFDQADRKPWLTTYESIQEMYGSAGYEVPKIVFWNLRATKPSFPATKDTPGVALVSGFSADLLKVFMEGGDFTPQAIMERAIAPYLEKVLVADEDVEPY